MPLVYMAPVLVVLGVLAVLLRKRLAPFFDVFWQSQGYTPRRDVIEWLLAGIGLVWALTGVVWLALALVTR